MRAPSGYLTRKYKIHKHIAVFHPEEHGFTVKISSRRHRHLINIVKRNTKTDGMGPFKLALTGSVLFIVNLWSTD